MADHLIGEYLKQEWVQAEEELVALQTRKDWHPGSNQQVLDIVHPSLYPIIKGKTKKTQKSYNLSEWNEFIGLLGDEVVTGHAKHVTGERAKYKSNYQWIPAEFNVDKDGKVTIESYINNLHPIKHKKVYELIAVIFEQFIGLFNKVLTDLLNPREDMVPETEWTDFTTVLQNIAEYDLGCHSGDEEKEEMWLLMEADKKDDWDYDSIDPELEDLSEHPQMIDLDENSKPLHEEVELSPEALDRVEYGKIWSEIMNDDNLDENTKNFDISDLIVDGLPKDEEELTVEFQRAGLVFTSFPDVPEPYQAPVVEEAVNLRGKKLQVIVKIAHVILTPENPIYPGGTLHVEGMADESIVSTGIYYFHSENISESSLSFSQPTREPYFPYQFENMNLREEMYTLYDLNTWSKTQLLRADHGTVETRGNRCIAFPNILMHQLSPFRLTDDTKPGYRKILVFFLIDPAIPILSSSQIPPQQSEWISNIYFILFRGIFPNEIIARIVSFLHLPMTFEEAEVVRIKLMDERKANSSKQGFLAWSSPFPEYFDSFSFCEH